MKQVSVRLFEDLRAQGTPILTVSTEIFDLSRLLAPQGIGVVIRL